MLGPNATQIDIEREIVKLVGLLETHTDEYEVLLRDAAKKNAAYKRDWAKGYLTYTEGSIKQRESWVDYQCSDQYFAETIAEALVKAKREKLTSLRTSLDALRTLSANIRAQT